MRKFVNKKRQKRKYIKKSEAASVHSSAKTAYSMIPLLIMLIAFMSTIVISAPLRDSLENIKFTIALPQFSFSNPLPFFETAWGDIMQIGIVLRTIGLIVGMTILQYLTTMTQKITYGTILLNNFIIVNGSGITNSLVNILKEFLLGSKLVYQGILFVISECGLAINFAVQTLIAIALTVSQFIARMTISVTNTTIQFSLLVIHYTVIATLTIVHFIAGVLTTFCKIIVSTAMAITAFFAKVFTAIIHLIEIPFKILYAFWLVIKPYVNFFGDHVKMSGNDFSNMFTSLGKVSSLVGVDK